MNIISQEPSVDQKDIELSIMSADADSCSSESDIENERKVDQICQQHAPANKSNSNLLFDDVQNPLQSEQQEVCIKGSHDQVEPSGNTQTHSLEGFLTEEQLKENNEDKLRIVRIYYTVMLTTQSVSIVIFPQMLSEEEWKKYVVCEWVLILFKILTTLNIILLFISHKFKTSFTLFLFIPFQIQSFSFMFTRSTDSILFIDDPVDRARCLQQVIVQTIGGFMNLCIFSWCSGYNQLLQIFLSSILYTVSSMYCIFGVKSLSSILTILLALAHVIFLSIFIAKLEKQKEQLILRVAEGYLKMKQQSQDLKKLNTMYQNIDSGVMLVGTNNSNEQNICFQNDIFQKFIQNAKCNDSLEILDLKIFSLKSRKDISKSTPDLNLNKYSLRELLKKNRSQIKDKIFKVKLEDDHFKYIQIKIKSLEGFDNFDGTIQKKMKLIQIQDLSDKILYDEIKAEQTFLQMINAAVSHELRNPLNSMIGQVSSMKQFFKKFKKILDEWDHNDQQQSESPMEHLFQNFCGVYNGLQCCSQKIASACKFVDFFVHDMLDYSVLQNNEHNFVRDCKNFDIREGINEIIQIKEDQAQLKEITIKVHYKGFEQQVNTDSQFIIKTDQKRLQQILLNLLSNAVKFTKIKGKIKILVEKYQERHLSMIRVQVIDNGIGIKKKDQSKIFNLFGSIKNQKNQVNLKGIGLGLVICRMIVKKFGGIIDFVTQYKKGSTFFFTMQLEKQHKQIQDMCLRRTSSVIPLFSEQQIESQKGVRQSICGEDHKQRSTLIAMQEQLQNLKDNGKRLLVVDDEEFCIASMRSILQNLGVDVINQVDFCINGEEALDLVRISYELGIGYSVIFTDFSMPIMDGIVATKKIRQMLEDFETQPIIIGVTGHASVKYEQIGLECGMNRVISKPMYAQTMRDILEKHYNI